MSELVMAQSLNLALGKVVCEACYRVGTVLREDRFADIGEPEETMTLCVNIEDCMEHWN